MNRMTPASVVCALVAVCGMIVMALHAYVEEHNNEALLVQGCDSFGYFRMANAMHDARRSGTKPDFFIHDAETRWIISKFKENKIPVGSWRDVVTAHAHHYFPGTDEVGPQYPPGTGWILSWFRADTSVRKLDRLTIACVAAVGILLVLWCAMRGLTMSSLVIAGAVWAVLFPYGFLGSSSYSINASILPIFMGTLLAWLAAERCDGRAAMVLGLCAGLYTGLAVQTRLASIFLVPVAALLFWPGGMRGLAGFLAGVCVDGIVPLLLHNKTITGSFLGATYTDRDQRQTLGAITKNSRFYFDHAMESLGYHVLGLFLVTLCLAAVIFATAPAGADWKAWLKAHRGMVWAPVCAFVLTLAFFLTHTVEIHYYLMPGMLQTCLLMAILFVSMETQWQKTEGESGTWGIALNAFAAICVAAGITALALTHTAVKETARDAFTLKDAPTTTLPVPDPMLGENAWIWADNYSGSIVYYTGHAAFKLPFSSPETRQMMYRWIQTKGYSQYMVVDSDDMKKIADETRAAGWQLSPAGTVREAACYKMERL